MIPLSVLDLSPIVQGGDAGQALRNSRELAAHAERLGYSRFWMAEHHNMPGIASAATAVALAFVGEGTSTIRLGAGGIMLPNHAPLVVAEQFGTLAALYPGRIDLGLGRAPGTDQVTMRALRRNMAGGEDSFPQDVLEILHYFAPAEPGQAVRAVPGEGLEVPVWMLGSSTYGAQLAAMLGLPYAFASHFAPAQIAQAVELYRRNFRPSRWAERPYLMLAMNVFAGETDAEGELLASSLKQAFLGLRRGTPGPLQPPVEDFDARLTPEERAGLHQFLSFSAVGSPETVRRRILEVIDRWRPDELMLTGQIYDHAARLRSFATAAEVVQGSSADGVAKAAAV